MRRSWIAAKHASSPSNTRAGPVIERAFNPATLATAPSGAPVTGSHGVPDVKPLFGSPSSQAIGWRYGSRPARSSGGSRPGPLVIPISSPW